MIRLEEPANLLFGHGFVILKIKVLNKLNLRFINQGVSGHRTYNFEWMSFQLNRVVLMIGVNAWRQFDFAQSPQFKMLVL